MKTNILFIHNENCILNVSMYVTRLIIEINYLSSFLNYLSILYGFLMTKIIYTKYNYNKYQNNRIV